MHGLFLYKITVNNFYQSHKNILYGITGYIGLYMEIKEYIEKQQVNYFTQGGY